MRQPEAASPAQQRPQRAWPRWLAIAFALFGILLTGQTGKQSPPPTRLCLDDPSVEYGQTVAQPAYARWPMPAAGPLTLRVRFLNGDSQTIARVLRYAQEWSVASGVKFKKTDSADAEIRVYFADDGYCQTALGSTAARSKGPTMHFGWLKPATPEPEFRRTVLHEFGHALGLVHEHQSPASAIQWNAAAVYEDCRRTQGWRPEQVDRNILRRYSTSTTQYSRFDPQSIMIYPIPPHWTRNGYRVDWNSELSPTDTEFVAGIYRPRN